MIQLAPAKAFYMLKHAEKADGKEDTNSRAFLLPEVHLETFPMWGLRAWRNSDWSTNFNTYLGS